MYSYTGPRLLKERCTILDVGALKRADGLVPGLQYVVDWRDTDGNTLRSLGVFVYEYPAHYTDLPGAFVGKLNISGEFAYGPMSQEIPLTWTACHYGGVRPWFRCPKCGDRAAKLYDPGYAFACRRCWKLAYACQRETKEWRLIRQADKLRRRLDDGCRPNGIWHSTFQRLWNDIYNRERTADLIMLQRFERRWG